MHFPVTQSLLKGLESAPDLKPVDLPDDIPLSEFSPEWLELNETDSSSESEEDSEEENDAE